MDLVELKGSFSPLKLKNGNFPFLMDLVELKGPIRPQVLFQPYSVSNGPGGVERL